MEKSKMMHRYEQETGKMSMMLISKISGVIPSFPTEDYIAWLEAKAKINYEAVETFQEIIRNQCDEITALKEKAEAYDRIMSGGKKTLNEIANIFGSIVAMDESGRLHLFGMEPKINKNVGEWQPVYRSYYEKVPICDIDFNGDWKDSLTPPDGWEA